MSHTQENEMVLDHKELLIRIDERTKHFTVTLDSIKGQMVTQGEFKPVRAIAYGLTGIMSTAILLAIIGMVTSQ